MSRERRVLLVLLSVSIAVALAVIVVPRLLIRHATLQQQVVQYERQIAMLRQTAGRSYSKDDIHRLRERVSQLRSRFYESGEIGPYEFASQVSSLLSEEGLTIERFQPHGASGEGDDATVEFVARGRVSQILRVLKGLGERDYAWSVANVTFSRSGTSETWRLVLQVGYETRASDDL